MSEVIQREKIAQKGWKGRGGGSIGWKIIGETRGRDFLKGFFCLAGEGKGRRKGRTGSVTME